MTIRMIRGFFVFLSIVCGYYIGSLLTGVTGQAGLMGALAGLVIAVVLMVLEANSGHVSLRNLSAAAFGLIFGFFMAWMVTLILRLIPMDEIYYSTCQIVFTLVFCYLGMTIAIKGKDEFNLVIPYVRFNREDERGHLYLLDTSVIIDGRIAGICETGFLEGKLIVPRFILNELQAIADSSDDAKRARGRRGLDMLNRLKTTPGVEVIVHDELLPDVKEVDAKLIRLARVLQCDVLTNDFNLNKVAKIEGIKVLNINDLAGAMRSVIFPGEKMVTLIRKEGKERNQGVAFMDDGTMIVVDNARKFVGKNVSITVTSVLQTSAGRMVFAETTEKAPEEKPQRQNSRPPRQSNRPPRQNNRPRRQDNRKPKPEEKEQKQADNAPKREDTSPKPAEQEERQPNNAPRQGDISLRPEENVQPQEQQRQEPSENVQNDKE